MSYSGFLIKVGNYTISTKKYIKAESYSITRNVQDLDSYRDANGLLHRNALEHAPLKCEFETVPLLNADEMGDLMAGIRANFTSEAERKASVTLFVPELNDYVTQDMYMPDPQFKLYGNYNNTIQYQSVRMAFIGY